MEETKTQCEEASKVLVLAGDISDERFVLDLFKQTVSTFGKAATRKIILDTRLDIEARRAVGLVIQRTGRWESMVIVLCLTLCRQNAGMGYPSTFIEDLPIEAFRMVMDVNVTSVVICTREAFKVFKAQKPSGGQFFDACAFVFRSQGHLGRITNNGSLSAHTPRPHSFPYTISKHAITGLTKTTAMEGRGHGITCTQIDIGQWHRKV